MFKKSAIPMVFLLFQFFVLSFFVSCENNQAKKNINIISEKPDSLEENEVFDDLHIENSLLILPAKPAPGEDFRVLSAGGLNLKDAKITISSTAGNLESRKTKTGSEIPFWRIDNFQGTAEGNYTATLFLDKKEVARLEFEVGERQKTLQKNVVWQTVRSWDSATETLYSAWINALFDGSDEQASWSSLHEVTQSPETNFLYNYLSLDEDNPGSKTKVLMTPDCADNPFFLRAYFAWKLGLPFGYHICDRGYIGKNPGTGQWITNESPSSKNNPVQAFNSFINNVMNGVHSGTARTALDNENSDYYPVSLERKALRPGTVFADPYGHTFVLVSWKPQSKKVAGKLLAVDAQPDKTIAIKRFWKGNFLFNTSEVVGEPGFKAFRPILYNNGKLQLMTNEMLADSSGFAPFSLQQKGMESEIFYRIMERTINPKPLDPETALVDLIQALHEQLLVRVKSVANGETYMQAHPGTIIPMPSNAKGVFLAGGQWENFSTPNRDLRLLIAMDAVLEFPDRVAKYPGDFNISKLGTPEKEKENLQSVLEKITTKLTITYTRTDGSQQELTLAEILDRRIAFEMAYNPNDGVEIRWGAQENSAERETCKRKAPQNQQKTMQEIRKWFAQRLHPPT
jgi:hypothetical protein